MLAFYYGVTDVMKSEEKSLLMLANLFNSVCCYTTLPLVK